jgi:hypothetical protein
MVMEQALTMFCAKEAEHTTHSRSNEWPPHPSSDAGLPGKQIGTLKHIYILQVHAD